MENILKRYHGFSVILVIVICTGPTLGEPFLTGVARVIDDDTLKIGGRRIRLHGIDAPESAQACEKDGKKHRCGERAAIALFDKIGRTPIRCEWRNKDRYKRIVAICRLGKLKITSNPETIEFVAQQVYSA